MKWVLTKIFICLLLLVKSELYAQSNIIYHGDKQYEATVTWKFSSPDNCSGVCCNYVEITVGKSNQNGILMISKDTPFKEIFIKGKLNIFLTDGTKITCIDRSLRDRVNNRTIVLYHLTSDEIKKLKQFRIASIRYSQTGTICGGNHTVQNKKLTFAFDKDAKDYYETKVAISNLFN